MPKTSPHKKTGIVALTKDFSPILPGTFGNFPDFFSSLEKTDRLPRFYQSILEMSQFVNIPKFFWGIIDDCLVVLWRDCIGHFIVMLRLPPLSIDCDFKREKKVIEKFRKAGAKVQLIDRDIEAYGYSKDDVTRDSKWLDEYVYIASEYGGEMLGGKLARPRNKRNKARKLEEQGIIRTVHTSGMSKDEFNRCNSVYMTWCKTRNNGRLLPSGHRPFRNIEATDNLILTYIEEVETNDILIFGITERVSNKYIIITTRMQNYDKRIINDPDCYIHHMESKYWMGVAGKDALMNFGAGITPSLTDHKRRLSPHHVLARYKLKPIKNVTREEWHECCPNRALSKKNEGFGL